MGKGSVEIWSNLILFWQKKERKWVIALPYVQSTMWNCFYFYQMPPFHLLPYISTPTRIAKTGLEEQIIAFSSRAFGGTKFVSSETRPWTTEGGSWWTLIGLKIQIYAHYPPFHFVFCVHHILVLQTTNPVASQPCRKIVSPPGTGTNSVQTVKHILKPDQIQPEPKVDLVPKNIFICIDGIEPNATPLRSRLDGRGMPPMGPKSRTMWV